MCGITGVAFADTHRKPDVDVLTRMCGALTHRGPDSGGGLAEPGVGLAMRRLSVIDVAGGTQPIFNEDQTVAVVFNGEIYNFQTLRKQLVAAGHRFTSNTDTEAIVHLYEQYGLDFVDHLEGMFAIAIWDFRQRKLILCRDRLGVKPLYYHADASRITFGSEIKSLLQDDNIPRDVNLQAIHQLLTFGHILPPNTAFQNIEELPPASMLIYSAGSIERRTYWDLTFSQPDAYDETKTIDELEPRIREAVSKRLISDVPIGAFLSGGIDSSIVVALMSQLCADPVKTFSIGFEDSEFSELSYARRVAKHCGTDHHEMIVKPDVPQIMEKLIRHHDSPFYDSSAIPTFYVSQFAREHVTVALSGDGGDEMFAGYNIFVANQVAARLQFIPQFLAKGMGDLVSAVMPESTKYINKARVAREFAYGLGQSTLERYTRWATKIKRETREQLYYEPQLRKQQAKPDSSWIAQCFKTQQNCTDLGRLLYLGTKTELPADMLRKVDRMSMAHSLEVRSPLLDHGLFEFAAGLHDDAKLNKRTTKHALRLLANRLLPPDVVNRPKRGFSIPLDRWLREDLQDFTKQILFDDQTEQRGLFDNLVVRQLTRQHITGGVSRGRELWTLLTIEMWQRQYIDRFSERVTDPPPLKLVSPMPQNA